MSSIFSISTINPPFTIYQDDARQLTKSLFQSKFSKIDRYLKVFENGEIEKRHLCKPLKWFEEPHSLAERNDAYIEYAVKFGVQAIENCLNNRSTLKSPVLPGEIDAIFYVSSSGISTPSIEARIMNKLRFRSDTKRIPLFGLGCAGGAIGLSRAYDYCKAYPEAKVLVLAVEFCSLTFQKDDLSKSNLIGASLFSDGIACALIGGEKCEIPVHNAIPKIIATKSKWMPESEDVMGWDIQHNGFHVIFSKSIPSIIENWLGETVKDFIETHQLAHENIQHFIAHPGGKKVLTAYEKALNFPSNRTKNAREILKQYGNMSSPTILYVLQSFLDEQPTTGEFGLMAALGPGFCAELLLLQWSVPEYVE